MFRNYIFDQNIAACCRCSEHIGSCLDHIRHNRIICTVQHLHTSDTDHIRTGTLDIGTHAVQEVCCIYNVWLFCRIFNNGISFCHRCCHHNINGCTYRYSIHENMSSMKSVRCRCHDGTVFDIDGCTQCTEAFQMQIDRAASDVTATRQRYFCFFIFSEKRTQQIIGCTDFLNIFVIYTDITDSGTVDHCSVTVYPLHFCSDSSDGL